MEDYLICAYYSNLSAAIRDGLRKILTEYKRKNEVEIAATLYKERKITLREAAAIMDTPVQKNSWEAWLGGVYLGYGIGEPGERILDDRCKRFHPLSSILERSSGLIFFDPCTVRS